MASSAEETLSIDGGVPLAAGGVRVLGAADASASKRAATTRRSAGTHCGWSGACAMHNGMPGSLWGGCIHVDRMTGQTQRVSSVARHCLALASRPTGVHRYHDILADDACATRGDCCLCCILNGTTSLSRDQAFEHSGCQARGAHEDVGETCHTQEPGYLPERKRPPAGARLPRQFVQRQLSSDTPVHMNASELERRKNCASTHHFVNTVNTWACAGLRHAKTRCRASRKCHAACRRRPTRSRTGCVRT